MSITFEFAENDYFEDKVLEKKFSYRRSKDAWCGLVSEPVPIQWKKDRDLTGGLLNMVIEAEKSIEGVEMDRNAKQALTPQQKALKKKIENTGMGGLSFFAWFGFIGRRISAEESAEAVAAEKAKRKNSYGKERTPSEEGDDDDTEEEDEYFGMSLEIFPDGDDLAVALSEDLWPGAIKYFSTSFLPFGSHN